MQILAPWPETVRVVRAETPVLRDQIYALRYQAYRRVDAIAANPAERFSDAYDHKPNAMPYLLLAGDRPVGSIRACVYRPGEDFGLPSFETYPQEIASQIGLDKRIVESSRFVFADEAFDVTLDMQYHLYRMIAANALVHEADWVITAMRRRHVPIYRRLFGAQRLSDPKPYYGLRDEMVLCGGPFSSFADACNRDARFMIGLDEARAYAL
jgi:hypothetical protein